VLHSALVCTHWLLGTLGAVEAARVDELLLEWVVYLDEQEDVAGTARSILQENDEYSNK
jgi:hypothetical protein